MGTTHPGIAEKHSGLGWHERLLYLRQSWQLGFPIPVMGMLVPRVGRRGAVPALVCTGGIKAPGDLSGRVWQATRVPICQFRGHQNR